jgi:hypothetical protein
MAAVVSTVRLQRLEEAKQIKLILHTLSAHHTRKHINCVCVCALHKLY